MKTSASPFARFFFLLLPLASVAAGCAHAPLGPQVPLEQQVEEQAHAQAPTAQRELDFFRGARDQEKTDYTVMLERGKCYWISGAADRSADHLALYLWAPPDHRRVAVAKPDSTTATLAHCPAVSGIYNLQAKVGDSGNYLVGLYAMVAPPGSVPDPPAPVYPAYATVVGAVGYLGAAPQTTCHMGSDGINSCGYNCQMGTNGHYYCSNFPGGKCAFNSNGTYTCPQAAAYGYGYGVAPVVGVGVVAAPATQCEMGSDGTNSCGYNCEHGSNGQVYCSSVPNGHCAFNADGSWSCP